MRFTVCNIASEFASVAEYLTSEVEKGKNIVLLKGDLGAGKTTTVKHYISSIGGDINSVDSPTFSLVNTYKTNRITVHHFDLYRLQSAEEIEEIGFMEYIDSGDLCFVEWPEKIANFLPHDRVVQVEITVSLNQCREYFFS